MAERTTLTFPTDLEVRGDGRTLVGVVAPFDTPTISDGPAQVLRCGAFTRTLAERGERVRFLNRPVELREDTAGLHVELTIPATPAGDAALERIRAGARVGIEFRSIDARPAADGSVEHRAVKLHQLVLVDPEPGAVESVDSSDSRSTISRTRLRLLTLTDPLAGHTTGDPIWR